ncbi:MAG: hypothetical protein IH617_16040 [Hydrogenophaga sp.]|nr:hypothetical protein [Hydrogenophaga sp.]
MNSDTPCVTTVPMAEMLFSRRFCSGRATRPKLCTRLPSVSGCGCSVPGVRISQYSTVWQTLLTGQRCSVCTV